MFVCVFSGECACVFESVCLVSVLVFACLCVRFCVCLCLCVCVGLFEVCVCGMCVKCVWCV